VFFEIRFKLECTTAKSVFSITLVKNIYKRDGFMLQNNGCRLGAFINFLKADTMQHQAQSGNTQTTPLLVNEKTISELIGMSVHFLRIDRRSEQKIPFFKIGGSVRYNPARVTEALEAMEHGGKASSLTTGE